jgi:glycosyltransferase involved in cell wall biosynthesis
MNRLIVAIVLPSLNEEAVLQDTCRSLGFCKSATSQSVRDAFLFIVDNGSADKTLEVAQKIRRDSPRGLVFVGKEKERGYVPPRHTGNTIVMAFAKKNGIDPSDVLILQADADTSYEEGYIERMRRTSQSLGTNILLEGLAEFSQEFRNSFPDYIRLSVQIDTRVLALLKLSEEVNLMCTDAVCGYRLSDYLSWGGHLREYCNEGDEIHAETTRLFMRALALGARKVYVREAVAHPAERKIVENPVKELATAGFPREASWGASWERQHHNSVELDDFHKNLNHPLVLHALRLRERHLIALFGLLPLHVYRTLGRDLALSHKPSLNDIAALLPNRHKNTLYNRPGTFLSDVLDIVDRRGILLSNFLLGQNI